MKYTCGACQLCPNVQPSCVRVNGCEEPRIGISRFTGACRTVPNLARASQRLWKPGSHSLQNSAWGHQQSVQPFCGRQQGLQKADRAHAGGEIFFLRFSVAFMFSLLCLITPY